MRRSSQLKNNLIMNFTYRRTKPGASESVQAQNSSTALLYISDEGCFGSVGFLKNNNAAFVPQVKAKAEAGYREPKAFEISGAGRVARLR